jgi:DNA replication protein DnaC
MNADIYNSIKKEYDRRQKKAYDELELRKAAIYRLVPRIEEIDAEIHTSGLKYNKLLLVGEMSSEDAVNELNKAIVKLRAEKAELLAQLGHPSDYLEPVFTCSKCSDTGIIRSNDGSPDKVCVCYKQQLIDHLYNQSNLSIDKNEGFNSFKLEYYSDMSNEQLYGIKKSPRRQISGIFKHCKEFVGNFKDCGQKNLFFSGPTGVGKTYMASCIAVELMNRGYSVLYQTAPSLFNTIYEYRYKCSGDDAYDSSVYKNILDAELLIIDDLGTESPSAMRYAELLSIIDTRCSNDMKKPCKTIIVTNIDVKKLFEYYDERVISRITGGFDMFRFVGDDIRAIKRIESCR